MTRTLSENDTLKWEHDGDCYLIHMVKDPDPLNPRRSRDPIATMACWHGRYYLGDELDGTPKNFWRQMVADNVSAREILTAIQNGKLSGLQVKQHDHDPLVDIYYLSITKDGAGKQTERWELFYSNVALEDLFECLSQDLTIRYCMALLEPYIECIPLWLYDHSGITHALWE